MSCALWKECLTLHYPYDELRGWLFLVMAIVFFEFSYSAGKRAYQEHGFALPRLYRTGRWYFPIGVDTSDISGRAITSIWMLFLGGISFQSWISYAEPGGFDIDPVSALPVVYLLVAAIVTVGIRIRWARKGLDD